MLLALKLKNFLSIEKESIISFLSSSFNDENKIIRKEDILNVVSFLGNNNSGKSNILKSIKVLKRYFLKNDRNFLKNTTFIKNNDKESNIEIIFNISSSFSKFYTLGIKYKKDTLISEYLYLTLNDDNKNIDKKIYEYNFLENKFINDEKINYINKKSNRNNDLNNKYKDFIKTSSLSSFLSFIKRLVINDKNKSSKNNFKKDIDKIYSFLRNDLLIFDPLSSSFNSNNDNNKDEEIYFKSFSLDKFNSLLKEFDLGIDEALFIKNNKISNNKFILKEYKLNTLYLSRSSIFKIVKDNKTSSFFKEELVFKDSNINYNFKINEESLGSRKLILLLLIISSLKDYKTYIFDEIDVSLHPLLFNKYLSLLNKINLLSSFIQFIFSTHYIDSLFFLNNESIYLVTKKNSVTSITSLIEYKSIKRIKNKHELIKRFKEGRYSGVPII